MSKFSCIPATFGRPKIIIMAGNCRKVWNIFYYEQFGKVQETEE